MVEIVDQLKNILSPSHALQGGVSPDKLGVTRVISIVGHMASIRDSESDLLPGPTMTNDWYNPSTLRADVVSLELAKTREWELKDALDDAYEDENRYPSEPGRVSGDVDAPCRIRKRSIFG